MATKKSIGKQYEKMRDSLLDVIVENFDYFKEYKSHLAWALMKFDLVHMGGRFAYNACQDNINESYRRVAENMTEEDENLFSNAWGIVQRGSEGGNYKDNFNPKDTHRTPLAELAGYTKAQKHVRKDIKDKILSITGDPVVAMAISQYKTFGRKIRRKKHREKELISQIQEAEKVGDRDTYIRLAGKLIRYLTRENE